MSEKELIKAIQAAEEELLLGNTILYPTDTVWGIGCDAENGQAVRKIFAIKEREESKTMIVLVADTEMLQRYVEDIPAAFSELEEKQERPTTYVFPKAKNLPSEVIAADGSVAIRVVKDEFCLRLIRQVGRPIISTSANISGEPAAPSFKDVSDKVKERVDYIVTWRQDEQITAVPSRIIKIDPSGEHQVLRD
ncbi:L-threonylcarbamoyladenylate synthase [Pontibacter sp. SGAir0037]|uniref:L-threonylcarbamoyladenylate synthase n=1 Tax=Pontibacter sp. SGAir0037 TaxID=2571030 RepID=UPI0010CD3416|nr:L-threonylcarbamoyladenylate synthase [Pontibacter sp. SGAir0037]QCR22938.1 threonylcarbamoyl-AMP synthase [Pontibacter sp. SGAir0037]